MKCFTFLSGFILALFLLSPGYLFSQTKLPVDSIPNYIKAFESNDSTCPGARSDIPTCWFELRNTALGAVIYEGDNRPFTIQFVDSNRLIEWVGAEPIIRRIDSVFVADKIARVICTKQETWGSSIVIYEFTQMDPVSHITHLKKTEVLVVRGVGSGESSSEKWVMPYSANRDYFILTEPNKKSPDSWIPFVPMDKNKLKLYR